MNLRLFRVASNFLAITLLAATSQAANVKVGMERLSEDAFLHSLRGKRIGVLAHHASRDSTGRHLIDYLKTALGLDLRLIFAPEHGLRSSSDTWIEDGIDAVSGLPVYSLYSRVRRAPERAQLSQIDVLVIDLQDVGMRYYTYGTTMAMAMQAASAAGTAVWVLDRPNPIGGERSEGLVLEPSLSGHFIAYFSVPTRHGMTMGELARLYNSDFGIASELQVVPMQGWNRTMLWNDTGLSWPTPSPALTDPEQAMLYSFIGPLESFNLAVGRGQTNEKAFRVVGAPWISSREADGLVRKLQSLGLPEIQFVKTRWLVTRGPFEGQWANGFEVQMADFRRIDSFEASVRIALTVTDYFGNRVQPNAYCSRYFGSEWLLSDLMSGTSNWNLIRIRSEAASRGFSEQRARALLY